ncbi:MAG: hypothetical protein J0H82_18595 [Alphaproteobacteria bacterium]|jgi:hypothetical protein|nr:hypothetical protein [Alphaproteobacteria bacterium]
MSRLSKLRVVDPVLTQLAIGYSNADYVSEVLMPIATVEKEGGKIPKFGKEAFRLYNTERALRTRSNRISPDGVGSIDVVLDEHDLEYPIDYREDAESAFPLQANATHVTTEGIQLRREKMVADIAQNPASYAASNKVVLSGASRFTDPSSDPIAVIEAGKEAVRARIGRKPNTAIIGASSYSVLKNHGKLLDRIKYAAKGVVTIDLMRELFEIKNIAVGNAVYADDQDVFKDIWGDNIVLAYVPEARGGEGRTPYEPAYGYTIRRRGMPAVDTRTEDGKLELIRNTDIFRPYLLGPDAGFLIADTNV